MPGAPKTRSLKACRCAAAASAAPRGWQPICETERIDLLIDATHPYAARISANAAEAARLAGVRAIALRRPAWEPVEGDRWTLVEDATDAVAALGKAPRKIFLALGRQEIAGFEAAPQHAYVIRSVDPVEPPLAVPDATYILARGPFSEAGDRALLEAHGIDAIVAKNSGGYGDLRQDRCGQKTRHRRHSVPPAGAARHAVRRDASTRSRPWSIMRSIPPKSAAYRSAQVFRRAR